ncbi:exosortase-associated protein EpsI, B-type [Pseudoduganella danionis]|uniref:exosortase-associated protein EpsI, B-type n=1 Tax=Pseudoduganella danionis TaxID=1890295 RepID=UPI0035AFCC4D
MKRVLNRSLIAGVLMFSTAGATVYLTPTQRLVAKEDALVLEDLVPKQFGDWKMDPNAIAVVPSEDTRELVAKIYDQTLNRTYVNSQGERIMLSIAYGGSQTRQLRAHRQEVCYTAQGFQISSLQQTTFEINHAAIRGTRMVAAQGNVRIEPVTYWFTMGNTVVQNYLDRQVAQLKYALSGVIPDGYLYRVSSISLDASEAFKKQDAFSSELLAHVDPKLATRLLGNVGK